MLGREVSSRTHRKHIVELIAVVISRPGNLPRQQHPSDSVHKLLMTRWAGQFLRLGDAVFARKKRHARSAVHKLPLRTCQTVPLHSSHGGVRQVELEVVHQYFTAAGKLRVCCKGIRSVICSAWFAALPQRVIQVGGATT